MGAISFSLDPSLISLIKTHLAIDVFVETGTMEGNTIDHIKDQFNQIYSIELSDEYTQKAIHRFQNFSHIRILQGNSANILPQLAADLRTRATVFWLDAHWCVSKHAAGSESQCPLLSELEAIGTLHPDSVIIIDDARLFLATPPYPHAISDWPEITSIFKKLIQLSSEHSFVVLNDCIIFYPNKIGQAIRDHAYHNGIDWLVIYEKSKPHDNYLLELQRKEEKIQEQHLLLQNLKKVCDEQAKALQKTLIYRLKKFKNRIAESLIL